SVLPAWRKRSCSGVLLPQPGRQTLNRIVAAEQDAICGPEISDMSFLLAGAVVRMTVVTLPALPFSVSVVTRVPERTRVREGGSQSRTATDEAPVSFLVTAAHPCVGTRVDRIRHAVQFEPV